MEPRTSKKDNDYDQDSSSNNISREPSIVHRLDCLETELNLLLKLSSTKETIQSQHGRVIIPTPRLVQNGWIEEDATSSQDTRVCKQMGNKMKKSKKVGAKIKKSSHNEIIMKKKFESLPRNKSNKNSKETKNDERPKTECRDHCWRAKIRILPCEMVWCRSCAKAKKTEKDQSNQSNNLSKSAKSKSVRKKESYCQCKKKRSKSTVVSAKLSPTIKVNRRSKSLDPKFLTGEHPIIKSNMVEPSQKERINKTAPTSAQDIRDLCSLISDLSKHKDLAVTISEEWKQRFYSMQKNCDSLKCLQEQTDDQRRFFHMCLEKEKQHRRILEQLMKDPNGQMNNEELAKIKQHLEISNQENVELKQICIELRKELELSQEHLQQLQNTNGMLSMEVLNKYESSDGLLKSQASHKVEDYKKQNKDQLREIEELRLTCAKNANWACEESSMRKEIQHENKFLVKKMTKLMERNEKQNDEINVLKGMISKITNNDPRVMSILNALKKKELDPCDICPCTSVYSKKKELDCGIVDTEDARKLITELTSVIQVQRNRIAELVAMTTDLVVTEGYVTPSQGSSTQCEELVMARKEILDVKRRNVALEKGVRKLRDSINANKDKLFTERQSRASFQNEVTVLTKVLEETNVNLKIKGTMLDDQADTIEKLKMDVRNKDYKIGQLSKELLNIKEEKNTINKKCKELQKEKDMYKCNCDNINKDLHQQQDLYNTLEKKFELIIRERDLQRTVIVSEKDQALRAAQFATNKLQETMEDFQKQSETQLQIRQALTKLLQAKDDQLKSIIDKMNSLTFDSQKVVDALKTVTPTCKINITTNKNSNSSFETFVRVNKNGNDGTDQILSKANMNIDRMQSSNRSTNELNLKRTEFVVGYYPDSEYTSGSLNTDNDTDKDIETEEQKAIEMYYRLCRPSQLDDQAEDSVVDESSEKPNDASDSGCDFVNTFHTDS